MQFIEETASRRVPFPPETIIRVSSLSLSLSFFGVALSEKANAIHRGNSLTLRVPFPPETIIRVSSLYPSFCFLSILKLKSGEGRKEGRERERERGGRGKWERRSLFLLSRIMQ